MDRPPLLQSNPELMGKEELQVSVPKKEQSWWQSWEFYLILLLAAVLRFYRIDTAQYMADHNSLYQMAHNAVAYGLWPVTANRSSTGLLFPPLFVYLMMIPATITPNPIAGNILIAFWNVLAVLLTYVFVRRYYGRLAGTIAALFYATEANVIVFSRDIWQPDVLPLLVILFLFVLFRGIVERKHYWFLPAILLIGIMYQFHSAAIYLIVLLSMATLLGFKTIRWRELPLALLGLSLLFAPYIYLESRNHLADIRVLFHVTGSKAAFNSDVLLHYLTFTLSYVSDPLRTFSDTHLIPSNDHSILQTTPLHIVARFSVLESKLMGVLMVAGVFALVMQLFWKGRSPEWRGLSIWLKNMLASPWNRGVILLLVWQGTILLWLRHSTSIYAHYLFFLLPGPFILIGILLSNGMRLRRHLPFPGKVLLRSGLYMFVGLIVIIQTVGSAGWLVDHMLGNFNTNYARPQYFDLATIQRMVDSSDRLALKQHIKHIYFDIHGDDLRSVSYLSQFAHTPMEVTDSNQCMVMPSAQSGPVVYVIDPNRPDLNTLLQHFTLATQVGKIQYPGGTPFNMYIVRARPTPQPSLQSSNGVLIASRNAYELPIGTGNSTMLATLWRIQNAQPPQPLTTYTYSFLWHNRQPATGGIKQGCTLSSTWTGDQLIPLFGLNTKAPHTLTMSVEKFSSAPQHYDLGSLKIVTFETIETARISLHMANGQDTIDLTTVTVLSNKPHAHHRKVPIH